VNFESIIPIIQSYWIQIALIVLIAVIIKNLKVILLAAAAVFLMTYFGFLDLSNFDFSGIIEKIISIFGGIEWQKLLVR
jgi:apolipoprotein N-acyltransferase